MDDIKYILDEEAAQLFSKLRGIDSSYGKDWLSESLEEEKKREDERKALLVEMVHLLSAYLLDVNKPGESKIENETFYHFTETFEQLINISSKKRTILIRYRGFANDPNVTEKDDYEVIYGNTIVDSATVSGMIKRLGHRMAHLSDQFSHACRVFSSHDIYTLYIKIPRRASAKQKDRFYDVLRALSRYKTAVETNSPIVFVKKEGQKLSFPLVCNERGLPDENLTLLAIANNLRPQTIKLLVDKIGKSSVKNRYMSIYNAIFSVKKLKRKLVKPAIEVNNVVWLMADQEKEIFSQEKAEVAKFAIKSAGGSPQKAAKVLKSVYGNDYDKIDSKNLDERLQLSSNLLNSVEKTPGSQRMGKEILGNIETRLEQVHDQVFDDLFTQKETDVAAGKKSVVFDSLHGKLLNTVTFFKSRIDIKKKMREIVHRAINFRLKDFETLAKDFDISIEEAKKLTEMLKECFDEQGRFMKGTFRQIMPEFSRYERKMFEFLWHYLREYIHQKDRSAYLNSLQLLIAKMQKPKLAIKILLSDFCKNTKIINYSDSKALMLCNLLIRKYSKGLIDLEITPEDVLQVSEGLDEETANYTAWRIDKDQNSFYEKMQTIHQNLVKTLDSDRKEAPSMPLPFLISLEREAYIFFSLTGGTSARSIVLSAVKEYGDPDSMIYHGKQSKENIGALLINLRIAIRGLGRVGGLGDLPTLHEIYGNEDRLAAIGKSNSNKLLVNQMMDFIDESKQQIIQRERTGS